MIRSFFNYCKRFLENPIFYHFSRQMLLLGMPIHTWATYGNYFNPKERIADIGCGPADILRFLNKNKLPEFYLGIDISDKYIETAKKRAQRIGLNAKFIKLDLHVLSSSPIVSVALVNFLNENNISTVNIFGVLHHLDDKDAISSLNTIFQSNSVRSLNTQDVLIIDRNGINNFYASLDRGNYVRNESQYDVLINQSNWKGIEKCWSEAGVRKVKYIHYRLRKESDLSS